jgi:hypothetical protein
MPKGNRDLWLKHKSDRRMRTTKPGLTLEIQLSPLLVSYRWTLKQGERSGVIRLFASDLSPLYRELKMGLGLMGKG